MSDDMNDDLPPHLKRRALTDERLHHERTKRMSEDASGGGRFAQVRQPVGVSPDPLKMTRFGKKVFHETPDHSDYWYD